MATDSRYVPAVGRDDPTTELMVVPADMGITPVVNVATALRRIKDLQEFVRAVMVKDEDYGIIPGTQKPTLFKPGAEKLCEMYGLAPTVEITNRVEQWETPFFQYEVRVRLVSKSTGVIVGEGIGSCNSREKRYKNQDAYGLVNTLQKMAKKRALVDATLSATRSSGLFTQDLEDLEPVTDARQGEATKPTTRPVEEKTFDRARAEKMYRTLVDQADVLGIPADNFNPAWPDAELQVRGQKLRAQIRDKEASIPTAKGTEDPS